MAKKKVKAQSKFGLIFGIVALVACVLMVVGVIVPVYNSVTFLLSKPVAEINVGGLDFVSAMFSNGDDAISQAMKDKNDALLTAISLVTSKDFGGAAVVLSVGILGTLLAAAVCAVCVGLKLLLKNKLCGKIAKFSSIGGAVFAVLVFVMALVLAGQTSTEIALGSGLTATAAVGAYLCLVGGLTAVASTFVAKY